MVNETVFKIFFTFHKSQLFIIFRNYIYILKQNPPVFACSQAIICSIIFLRYDTRIRSSILFLLKKYNRNERMWLKGLNWWKREIASERVWIFKQHFQGRSKRWKPPWRGNAVQNKITAKAAHLASCFHKGDAIKLGKWIVSFIPKLLDRSFSGIY